MGFRSILVARETVGKGHEARKVAAAARGEGNEPEVGVHAEVDAIGELIARESLYAGIEAPGTGSREGVAVVIEFAAVTRGTIPHLFFSFSLKVFPSPLMFFTIC